MGGQTSFDVLMNQSRALPRGGNSWTKKPEKW